MFSINIMYISYYIVLLLNFTCTIIVGHVRLFYQINGRRYDILRNERTFNFARSKSFTRAHVCFMHEARWYYIESYLSDLPTTCFNLVRAEGIWSKLWNLDQIPVLGTKYLLKEFGPFDLLFICEFAVSCVCVLHNYK